MEAEAEGQRVRPTIGDLERDAKRSLFERVANRGYELEWPRAVGIECEECADGRLLDSLPRRGKAIAVKFEAPIEPEYPISPALALFPKYAFAGPGGVLPLLTSLLAPLGAPLPALDWPVPPPPAAYAKLGIKINATVAKDLSFIAFPSSGDVERCPTTCPRRRCSLLQASRNQRRSREPQKSQSRA
jgi:hypothetical protein